MKPIRIGFLLLLAVALSSANLSAQTKPAAMVVHEWGTFTSLQNEAGQAIGGINTDDEPVPKFVHRLANFLLLNPTEVPSIFFQGAPRCHPDVTMRLETPVVYFHPPPGQPAIEGVSVTAQFRGGWLSEFYPDAVAHAPGVQSNSVTFGSLLSSTVSTLAWNNLQIGGDWPGPATTDHVWTAPRAVRAAPVRTTSGEAEKFLFYRGVAHIEAPIAVTQVADATELILRGQCAPEITGRAPLKVKSLWLVDIAANGKVAFRLLPPVDLDATGKVATRISGQFAPGDYRAANRETLKASLHEALVADGLFADEARALLDTWELSYFKSPGMRVFFLVPRVWTDFYLPLSVSVPAEITRVMVGRIELVTREQRDHLQQLGQISTSTITNEAVRLHTDFYGRITTNPKELNRVDEGRQSLKAFGVSVPKSYQLYLSLGRFRNALILEEARKRPAQGLDGFIATYRLEGYKPVDIPAVDDSQKE
jgi:hypothetical protein